MRGNRTAKRASGKKLLLAALLLFFTAEALVGAAKVRALLREYEQGRAAYAELSRCVDLPRSSPAQTSQSVEDEPPQECENVWPKVDFAALREINRDIVGWIYIEGTEINYPVVQAGDNDYYLNHLFSGEVNRAGCIFLDSGNSADFSDKNSVIYGHHMKNDTMFTQLLGYKKQEFYDAHPVALLLTPEANYEVKFFSGYVSGVEGRAWERRFPSEENFAHWLDDMRAPSAFSCDVVPTVKDRVLTLSTCTYEFNNARFVVMGILTPRE